MSEKMTRKEREAYRRAQANLTDARRESFGKWFRTKGWRHLVGWVVIVYSLFPLVFVLSGSFSSGTQFSSDFFRSFTTDNYVELFSDPFRPYANWFINTIFISGTSALGAVFLSALAAYA